ncbi:MAG: PQQ-binding-like beta-propeller repeat protein [Candidatus Bathyarchaeota archaeon]|nr:PQQ-binding-like beta-propeller repeat protein [Candidatus Termiticorpusculum sp.]MCL2868098.1 PQQ-binding-like beta-propeller repeat protein [Candidatus Termiticorpusculum sp.]
MNYTKSKNIVKLLAVLLMLSFIISMIAVPSANAQTYRESYPFVEPVPRTVGVGQAALINFGLLNFVALGSGWNMTLTIIDPDGKVETFDRMTWSTGTVGLHYTPTKAGNYTLIASMKEQRYGGTTTNPTMYKACESENVTLQVLEDWYKPWHPGHSMPTDYWTRPVDSQLREWYSLMGSWLAPKQRNGNMFAPYNEAPTTAHILWSTPDIQYTGGLAGGALYEGGFQHGDAYESKFYNAIIIAGVLYYNVAPVYSVGSQGKNQTIRALDLHTGKELWTRDISAFGTQARLSRGQVHMYMTENNRGAWAYLWVQNGGTGTTWWALDPLTGEHMYTMTGFNSPSAGGLSGGTKVYYGPNGEMLTYSIFTNTTGAYLRQHNSSMVIQRGTGSLNSWGMKVNIVSATNPSGISSFNAATLAFRTSDDILLARNFGQSGVNGVNSNPMGNPIQVFPEDRAIFATTNASGIYMSAVSLEEDSWGARLYTDRFWKAPENWESITGTVTGDSNGQTGWACFSDDPYVGVFWTKEDRVNHVFNLDTGKHMYDTPSQFFADGWGGVQSNSAPEKVIAYGCLISGSGGGIVYCYNVSTGELLWTYEAKDPYIGESYLVENWYAVICFVSDGKVYFGHSEHSAQEPKPRGAPFYALDIETGEVVWRIDGAFRQLAWGGRAVIGDSIIATIDSYDSQIYAIGKGPSELTVSAPNYAVTAGTTALITGTVMDISPGTNSDRSQLHFPKGVPVASDETQSEWMLHVYKQFEAPAEFKGVEVSLYAWDGQSSESVPIGTTTTDIYGKFAIEWTPTKAGQYEIFAFFDGSGAYYSSEATAATYVSAAPEVVEVETPPYEWYIVGAAIAIIAVVIVIGLLNLKKK